ncbi:uncharacterized protein LOC9647559 isoform X2 [Selaginella moellendorffii]|uniref:uncharacterized protein LOC9647559 isoform X2 n=1 Tax=Selaginella moellendorffii TaxID=88036 RepID=UPI000D1CEE1C|nr:uncharacterized protein LOC9647559 isoform X2 [Selaginella moellendorffii]|eukprot:XP_024542123.1 uncharacterized protein LOC9647559 isoform X2 [Selaginella moellendorffii]
MQVRQLLERNAKDFVVATCRNPVKAENLAALKEKYPDRLQVLGLDVTDEDTIKEAANQVSKFHGPLELLVNTAGILHVENLVTPETSLSKLEKDALLLTFQINAAGPALVMKHMSPLLKSGGSREVPVIANLSARVGSIGDNKLGGWLSYRASKTALNHDENHIDRASSEETSRCLRAAPSRNRGHRSLQAIPAQRRQREALHERILREQAPGDHRPRWDERHWQILRVGWARDSVVAAGEGYSA